MEPGRAHPRGGPLLSWLLVALPAAASTQLTGDIPWATVVVAFAGMAVAVFFGLVAVPWSRAGRWAVTALVVGLFVAGVVVTYAVDAGGTPAEKVGGTVITAVPAALLLLLVWLRLRRGCAWVALLFTVVGLVAHLVTVVRLVGSAGGPAWGAWAMLALVVLAVAGAATAVRTTPPRDRVSPARTG